MTALQDTDPWRPLALADLSQAQLDGGDSGGAYATAAQALAYGRKALHDRYELGLPLLAMGRAELARKHASAAEPLLREALALRLRVHPPADPRVLEIQVALIDALTNLKRSDEAQALRTQIEPLLTTSASPYLADLHARLTHD